MTMQPGGGGELYFEDSVEPVPNPLRVILPVASVSTAAVLVAVFFVMDAPGFVWVVALPGVVVADAVVFVALYRLGKTPPQVIRVTGDAVSVEHDGISQTRIPIRDIRRVETRIVMGETQVVVTRPAILDSGQPFEQVVIRGSHPEELVAAIEWARAGAARGRVIA